MATGCRVALTVGLDIALTLNLTGCATWRLIEKERLANAMERSPHHVRVASRGSIYELTKPGIGGDTLRGRVDGRDVTLPISAVDSLWIRQNNRKTTRLVAIVTVAMAAAFVVGAQSINRGMP
jgi:hypothetical protein